MIARIVCTFLVAVAVAAPAAAQHALVLSGGGARGLSHAGALLALEELGYRPPFVAGTSMGAIIGALYAAGYTPVEIRDIVAGENWLVRFAAVPVPVGPAREPRRPQLGVGVSRGRFHGGFIPAAGINLRLVELLFDAGVRARNDFDALPVPFRAVATDLATGAEIVLIAGDLPRAVRASMAVPGVFSPVRWNELVLVDGGVANNLPVSVARRATDLPVIAVDVLRPSEVIEERGALDVGVRALRLLIENARPDELSQPDLLVVPRLEPGLSETYFPADARPLIRAGYQGVREQIQPADPMEPGARRGPGPQPSNVADVIVAGADASQTRLITRIMARAIGQYDADAIVGATAALYATGLFEAVWPRIEFAADDTMRASLIIDVVPAATSAVSAGARWNNDVGAGAWASLRQYAPIGTPLELRLTGAIDELHHLASVDASIFSAALRGLIWNAGAHAIEERIRIVTDTDVTGRVWSRREGAWAGAEYRLPVQDWFASVLLRADHTRGPADPEGWALGPYVRLGRGPAPDRVVGVDPLLEAELREGDAVWRRARMRGGFTARSTELLLGAFIDAAVSSSGVPLYAGPATDPETVPWLPAGALRSRHFAAVGVDLAVPTVLSGYIRARGRAVAAVEELSLLERSEEWRLGGEVGGVWPTVLGRIHAGVGFGEHARWRFNVAVGHPF